VKQNIVSDEALDNATIGDTICNAFVKHTFDTCMQIHASINIIITILLKADL